MTDIKNKTFEELTPDDCKELKVEFAPGALDDFEGTQEELDELIAEITKAIHSGEILETSRKLDLDELIEEEPEIAEKLLRSFEETPTRKLQ